MKVAPLFMLLVFWSGLVSAEPTNNCLAGPNERKQVLWGDLHVHTAYSLDAMAFGTIKTPTDAYRFAKGHPIQLPDGSTVYLDRPLDFMAVTDPPWRVN